MNIRMLQSKDAPYMLEWMSDKNVTEFLQANFASKTIEDCQRFIELSHNDKENLHMAVVDEYDEYMGTVSLKNIKNGSGEFAISMRAVSMGKGFAKYGMEAIICKGLKELNLDEIYWCVSPDNKRAVRFYDKNAYQRTDMKDGWGNYSEEQGKYYLWYVVKNS